MTVLLLCGVGLVGLAVLVSVAFVVGTKIGHGNGLSEGYDRGVISGRKSYRHDVSKALDRVPVWDAEAGGKSGEESSTTEVIDKGGRIRVKGMT